MKSAQVYSTLQRLARDGLADLAGVAAGEGPERQAHHARLREMREARRRGDVLAQLDADFEMYHLDADLRWIDGAEARLDRLAAYIQANRGNS